MNEEFKPSNTLLDDHRRTVRPAQRGTITPSFLKSKTHKCEHHDQGICAPSREAFRLGLRKELILCSGNIPPDCKIRQALSSGKTVMEIYQK